MVRLAREPIGEFWKRRFDGDERDFTDWMFGSQERQPVGWPSELRFEIERATDTYLWDLSSEQSFYEGEFRIDGTGTGFHQGEYSDVVIEVQFDRSKSAFADHLGRLFVYAQRQEADVIIWITPKEMKRCIKNSFSKSISYINNISDISIYQIYIEVEKRDDNELKLQAGSVGKSPGATDDLETKFAASQKKKFWIMLEHYTGLSSMSSTQPKADRVYRCGKSVPTSGANPEFRVNTKSNQVKFRIRFENEEAEKYYRSLKYRPTSRIEDSVDRYQNIYWRDGPKLETTILEITRKNFSIHDQNQWESHINWLGRTLNTVKNLI